MNIVKYLDYKLSNPFGRLAANTAKDEKENTPMSQPPQPKNGRAYPSYGRPAHLNILQMNGICTQLKKPPPCEPHDNNRKSLSKKSPPATAMASQQRAYVRMDSKTPPLLPRFLRAIYWFDEALRASQELQGETPVTRAQAMLLINIALGERRPTRLARTMGVTKQAVSLMLGDLTAAGYIFIKPDTEDARASLIEFTPQGQTELNNIFAALEHLEDYLATVIGQDRMFVLRAALGMDWGTPPALESRKNSATDTSENMIQKK